MKMYRQGDVLLVRVDERPTWIKLARSDNRVTIAEGEVTGHAHVLVGDDIEVDNPAIPSWLNLAAPGRLVHDEHAPIDLEPGTYQIVRQRQYTWDDAETAATD